MKLKLKCRSHTLISSFDVKEMVAIQSKISNSIKMNIGIRVKVTLIEPKSIPRSEGKAVRVIDKEFTLDGVSYENRSIVYIFRKQKEV